MIESWICWDQHARPVPAGTPSRIPVIESWICWDGGSECFCLRHTNLSTPTTMDEAKRLMDQQLVLAGHLLAECVDRDRRALEAVRRCEDVARVST